MALPGGGQLSREINTGEMFSMDTNMMKVVRFRDFCFFLMQNSLSSHQCILQFNLNYWTTYIWITQKISFVRFCFPSLKKNLRPKLSKTDASLLSLELQQADGELLKALKDDLGNLTR